jgi:AcrR family transcriptional regulator
MTDSPVRARNAAATRAALLTAARRHFARESYDNVGMRGIARDAGVDAALVSRYFGSKEDLFAEALAASGDARELFEGDPTGFGARVAYMLVHEPQNDQKLEGLLMMLHSASSPKAAEVVRRSIRQRFHDPFAAWLGGEDAQVRVRLAGAMIMGLALSRALTGDYELDEAGRVVLARRVEAVMNAAVAA